MNDDPQLTIFEPLKNPRTVTLKVIEDINAAPPVIFDENGHKVTNYKVLYDESLSAVCPKEEIIAYIENWESRGNVIDEKQARKIAKRKRIQETKKLKKERNKKRKAAMKSLIHCNFDTNPLANANVEEERAILRAMKTQKHSIKNVLNIKPNRVINCNTNVSPFENSTIEIGSKKTTIDVVVLDSDEESDSGNDKMQINIKTPQPMSTSKRRTKNLPGDGTFRNQNYSAPPVSNARKRRNKKVEIVQIVDSSDSDVECVSCEEFIQSLSDDDDENSTWTSKKKRSSNIILENESTANSDELDCVPVDEEASNELVSMVDSFYNKYIQPAIAPLTEIACQTDSEIAITEPCSLQSSSTPVIVESRESLGAIPQIVITETVSLRPTSPLTRNESKKRHKRQVTFNNAVDEKTVNDDELLIVENEPIINSVQSGSHESDADEEAESENSSDDSNEFEQVSEDDDKLNTNVLEFDSIPSPDYTPTESIPATASNIKAIADFIRSRRLQDSTKDDEPEYDSPIEMEELTPAITTKSTQKPNNLCPTSSKCDLPSSKIQYHPWQKRSLEKSDEILVEELPNANRVQSVRPWQKPRQKETDEIEVIEHPAESDRPRQPWQKHCDDKSDEIQVVERLTTIRNQPPYFQKKPPVSVITRTDRASQVDFDDVQQSFSDHKLQSRPFQRSTSLPRVDNTNDSQSQRPNRPSAFNRLDNANFTPASQPRGPNRRRAVFERLGSFQADVSKPNSAVEFFDKKSIRIGESQNEARNEEYLEEESYVEPADGTRRKFYPKNFFCDETKDASNEPFQNQRNPQRRSFNSGFHQQQDGQCSAMSVCEEEESWQYDSMAETRVDDERIDIDNKVPCEDESNQSQKHREEFPISVLQNDRRDKCHSGPYEQAKYTPKFNRYHPEPYEETKYTPGSVQPFDNNKIPWRNQNRGRFYRGDQFRRNNQYHNQRVEYDENNSNQSNRFRPRFLPNQGQRFDRFPPNRRFFRQNTPRYNQHTGGNVQNSYNNYQSSYAGNNYPNRLQVSAPSSSNTCNTQTNTNREVLFTRREKFNYKANVGDFDDCNDQQQQQSSQMNSCNRDRNTNCYQQNDVKNYETDVAKKLRSNTNNENSFMWENNRSCDFVSFNANEPVESSPPWYNNDPNTNYNPRIKAISRRQWINDSINSKT